MKRYFLKRNARSRGPVESPDGTWVRYADAAAEVARLTKERDRYKTTLDYLKDWAEAYPVDVFTEPDMGMVARALRDAGTTVDVVSASIYRRALGCVSGVISVALGEVTP